MIRTVPMVQTLLGGTALLALAASPALAQVTIEDDRTDTVRTSTAGENGTASDVTIGTGGSVVLDTVGPAVILDSDNDLVINGTVGIDGVDNATGVELQGGADRSFSLGGNINITDPTPDADTDDDPLIDTPVANGTGRRGILVSGASPFSGDITVEQAGQILVEGNQSFGVDLSNTPIGAGLEGDFTNNGRITLRGDEGAAVRVATGVTGNVVNNGTLDVAGMGSNAFDISGDINGGLRNTNAITNSGFRFNERPPFNPNATIDITTLGPEDITTAGSAVRITANIDGGIAFQPGVVETEQDDGTVVTTVVSTSSVSQFGNAPAVLIDGEGTPIVIGRVSPIIDPDAEGFDENTIFAFVQQGTLQANGIYDEFDATVLSVTDATLVGGIRNGSLGQMRSSTIIGSELRELEGVDRGTGLSRVIVLGDNAIAEAINNAGLIEATALEAVDQVYFDLDNIPAPRRLEAIAIDIGANATAGSLVNEGAIGALLVGRDGTATVVRDASGTLDDIVNRGNLAAAARSSDPDGDQGTNFTLIALDLSANISGVSFLQERREDSDLEDDIAPPDPNTVGDILLGSGDDSVVATAGRIIGDIDFAGGNDTLSLDDAQYAGVLSSTDGLDITVTNNGLLGLADAQSVSITSASFDETSTFRPTIDGATGEASTLNASGAISFAAGSTISPVFNNLISSDTVSGASGTGFTLATASELTVGDIAALNTNDDGSFLFDTEFSQVGDTLVVTVDLRGADALGLDRTQTGIGGSVFNATLQALQGNSALGNEIANLGTAGEFYAAYNQLLPEFAASSRQFVSANTDGAVGAVANHLDSARRSPDKPGGAWLQEFAYFADRELAGLSEQYRGEGFGFAAGLDREVGPFHAVGVNVGFASTEIEDVVGVDQPLDVTTLVAGLYAGLMLGDLGLDGYVGGGLNTFEQNRRVRIGDFLGDTSGDWDGTHVNASLRAGYDIDLSEKFWARPVVSVDYLRLNEDAYTETGPTGLALSVQERTSELGSVSAMLNFGAAFQGKRTWIRPSVRVGYRNEFISDPVLTQFQFAGVENAMMAEALSADFPSSGVLLGFSVAAGSGFSSVGFDFDSDIRDGFVRHTGRLVVRLLF